MRVSCITNAKPLNCNRLDATLAPRQAVTGDVERRTVLVTRSGCGRIVKSRFTRPNLSYNPGVSGTN